MATTLSTHTALAAKATLSAAARAAHACAAMTLASGGAPSPDDAWRVTLPDGVVGAVERAVAAELLAAHGESDARVASACEAMATASVGDVNAHMRLAVLFAAIALAAIVFIFDGPSRRRPKRNTTRAAAIAASPRVAPVAKVVATLRRADALLRVAAEPAEAQRRGVRRRRLGVVCACGGVPC